MTVVVEVIGIRLWWTLMANVFEPCVEADIPTVVSAVDLQRNYKIKIPIAIHITPSDEFDLHASQVVSVVSRSESDQGVTHLWW